ncbi:DUF2225 domain-containing protein [Halalkalibacter sp. APA_J-10(15)]|uniref:DUF2225 domain-containing protein n=1 Tax=unclassified Halalkalibacter TaxID=2893063 RepID=UPI001FF5B5A5|nr:DUF2225 domain-containing protein [Halalkalibacter sp. APA_J-10(15)]MCK0470336.1 DUF2225 domain-containing protein [Halalkalibacter sp. APA_J-10(15)]
MLTPLYDKESVCQICAHKHSTKRVRTRFLKVENIHTDFFTEYKDSSIHPLLYEAIVCPNCGFAFMDTFSSSINSDSLNVIKEQLRGWSVQDFGQERHVVDAIKATKLAVISGMVKKEKTIVMASLCLRLGWLCRMRKDEQEERRFLLKALEKYKASYLEADYDGTTMTDIKMLYMIGEIARRVEHTEDALKYLAKVVEHKNKHEEKKIVEMAREQWYAIRENDKERQLS